jgi:hypothetical protein
VSLNDGGASACDEIVVYISFIHDHRSIAALQTPCDAIDNETIKKTIGILTHKGTLSYVVDWRALSTEFADELDRLQ